MNKVKTILIVDDHTLFRNGLKLLLQHYSPDNVIIESENGEEAVSRSMQTIPDIILMDINMPVMNGIEATRKILQSHPDACIIALTMHGDESYYYQMIDAGAKGFLMKNSNPDEVLAAMEQVCAGKHYFPEEILYSVIRKMNKSANESDTVQFSVREKEVMLLICKGLSNQEIGEKLFISKRTVDNHRASLLEKTQSKNTAQLVMYAIKKGIIEL
ncbi:MAG: response regulator transcription factor [Bacteroidales bacterium]|nr:response regulator transcription factor [Bacteroidales bacterium]